MSLLAPFFLAGAAAIGLPILAHLIRRRPRGQVTFSSLMFLRPSPPTLTRRSRLDQWPLLLIRGLVLLLLALAFARPFWRTATDADVVSSGRRLVVLVDTSASMRRGDLWRRAIDSASSALSEMTPADRVALVTFDRQPRLISSFDDTERIAAGQRPAELADRLSGLEPGWFATDLGSALKYAAELVSEDDPDTASRRPTSDEPADESAGESAREVSGQVVLITDLQAGSEVASLQAFAWPVGVQVDVRPLSPAGATNASARLLTHRDGLTRSDGLTGGDVGSSVGGNVGIGDRPRVRVLNSPDADKAQFRLAWGDARGQPREASALPVQVPPGESRVFRMPAADAGDASLVLLDDDQPFDNVRYFVTAERRRRSLLYVGADAADFSEADSGATPGPFYYLARLPLDDPQREIVTRAVDPGALAAELAGPPADGPVETSVETGPVQPGPVQPGSGVSGSADVIPDPPAGPPAMVVVGTGLADAAATAVGDYLRSGGRLLVVLTGDWDAAEAESLLRGWSGDAGLTVTEAEVADYAMLGRIDFRHPFFAAMSDPQFSDFSKIRFWAHRRLQPGDGGWNRPAMFDDGDVAILERRVGEGMLAVLTSGWHTAESQLALSTKFLPLMVGVLGREPEPMPSEVTVGDRIESPLSPGARLRDPAGAILWPNPDPGVADATADPPVGVPDRRFVGGDRSVYATPGIYVWEGGGSEIRFAANLDDSESRTEPLEMEVLEGYGVPLGKTLPVGQRERQARQLRDRELEDSQRWWQWLLAAALAMLGVEAGYAGRLARRPPEAIGPVKNAGEL